MLAKMASCTSVIILQRGGTEPRAAHASPRPGPVLGPRVQPPPDGLWTEPACLSPDQLASPPKRSAHLLEVGDLSRKFVAPALSESRHFRSWGSAGSGSLALPSRLLPEERSQGAGSRAGPRRDGVTGAGKAQLLTAGAPREAVISNVTASWELRSALGRGCGGGAGREARPDPRF